MVAQIIGRLREQGGAVSVWCCFPGAAGQPGKGSGVPGNIPGTGAGSPLKTSSFIMKMLKGSSLKGDGAVSELSTWGRQRCSHLCHVCCYGGTEGPESSENKAMRQNEL